MPSLRLFLLKKTKTIKLGRRYCLREIFWGGQRTSHYKVQAWRMRRVSTRFGLKLSKLRTDLGGQPPEVTIIRSLDSVPLLAAEREQKATPTPWLQAARS